MNVLKSVKQTVNIYLILIKYENPLFKPAAVQRIGGQKSQRHRA
mgnify:CR=1 FL=1